MAVNEGVLVNTESDHKQHFSEDMTVTFCGHPVAGYVVLSRLSAASDMCQNCLSGMADVHTNPVVVTIMEARQWPPEAAAPGPSPSQQEPAPQPQEPRHEA
jgi:hypothetical protein